MTITDIATTVGISHPQVYKWIHRFVQEGVEGLHTTTGPSRRLRPLPHALSDQRNNLEPQNGRFLAFEAKIPHPFALTKPSDLW